MLNTYPDIATSEAQTKNSLIEPLLRRLGYDPSHPEQVTLEVSTELGGKMDYVLTGRADVKIAVEAKRAGVKLSEKETNQLRSYFTFSEVIAGVLTNGVQYWLFTDLDKTNVMDAQPYRRVNLGDPSDIDVEHLQELTRSRVQQSSVHEKAKKEQYRLAVNEIVAGELNSPSQEFLKLIGKKAGVNLTKTNLEFLGPLVTGALNAHLHKEGPPDPPKAVTTRKQFAGATLFGKKLSVNSYREVLTSVVAELQTRHGDGFATRVRDEKVFRGKKRWYLSTEQHHLSPRTKHKVGDYWVDTKLNARDTLRRARRFLKAFGHDPDELVIHTSND